MAGDSVFIQQRKSLGYRYGVQRWLGELALALRQENRESVHVMCGAPLHAR